MIRFLRTHKRMMALLTLMLVSTGILAPGAHAQSVYSVRIENATLFTINRIYMSPVSSTVWDSDLLGEYTLRPGYHFTTRHWAGVYDLKLVDQDGDVCVVRGISINEDTSWRITNVWLLGCQWRSR